jgi:hypothetical protein
MFLLPLLKIATPLLAIAGAGIGIKTGMDSYDKYKDKQKTLGEDASVLGWAGSLFSNDSQEQGTSIKTNNNNNQNFKNESIFNINITGNNSQDIAQQIKDVIHQYYQEINNSIPSY